MPNEPTVATQELFDALKKENELLKGQLDAALKEVNSLKKKAKPLEDVAVYKGRTIRIAGQVEAKYALDEVKKGHIDEDLQLLIPHRD